MPKLSLLKQDGTNAGEITLNDTVFGIEPNEKVVVDVILSQRASLRQGTHKVKNRSEVRGGGRKPWRQKGTGRARQGSIRSPQWRGGGVVFGPTPRSYAYKLPKKVRRLAIKSILSSKVNEEKLVVLEGLTFDAPKTKEFAAFLKNISVDTKALIVVAGESENVELSARNLQGITVIPAESISVLEVAKHDKLIITKATCRKSRGGARIMDARDIIKRPVVTEESTSILDDKKYTFEVDTRATKTQVKYAVEEIFDVKVAKVNVMNYKGKLKRMGRYAGYTNKRRKAIVTVTADSKEIQFFEV